jgi:hypothetical protein
MDLNISEKGATKMLKANAAIDQLESGNTTKHLTTEEFARGLGVKAHTVRRGLCVNGHYLGVRPIKLPNRRLLWPKKAWREILGAVEA